MYCPGSWKTQSQLGKLSARRRPVWISPRQIYLGQGFIKHSTDGPKAINMARRLDRSWGLGLGSFRTGLATNHSPVMGGQIAVNPFIRAPRQTIPRHEGHVLFLPEAEEGIGQTRTNQCMPVNIVQEFPLLDKPNTLTVTNPHQKLTLVQELTPVELQSSVHTELQGLGLRLLPQNVPLGGRLRLFVANWATITQDPWILQIVRGYELELTGVPQQTW
jgi:hypothetical protein